MIYPRKNLLYHTMVDLYTNYILMRYFRKIKFDAVNFNHDKSILLIANHFSIWDGLILYHLNKKLFKKQGYAMILEDTAKKEPMLKYIGTFSVQKGSKDIIQSLNYAATLLNDPQNLVLILPQGKLYSNFVNEIVFEKGIMKIIKQAAGKFDLVFAATFIESFNYKKATPYVYLKNLRNTNFETIDALTNAYQVHYNAAKAQQTAITT